MHSTDSLRYSTRRIGSRERLCRSRKAGRLLGKYRRQIDRIRNDVLAGMSRVLWRYEGVIRNVLSYRVSVCIGEEHTPFGRLGSFRVRPDAVLKHFRVERLTLSLPWHLDIDLLVAVQKGDAENWRPEEVYPNLDTVQYVGERVILQDGLW